MSGTAKSLTSLQFGLNVFLKSRKSITKYIVEELCDLERKNGSESHHQDVLDSALSPGPSS
jgi:hypothetical protein